MATAARNIPKEVFHSKSGRLAKPEHTETVYAVLSHEGITLASVEKDVVATSG